LRESRLSLPEEQGVPGYGLSSYEVVPYVGKSFSESHPDRLATIATLFGMKPRDVSHARVLEIGCGVGANIIPMGAELPEGSFLGIDSSERQVAEGRATIEAAGLKNVELRPIDIMDACPELGTFDYIVCHGVFSWVAPAVQQKILSMIATHLAKGGVAYVSYNVYPGWHFQQIIREAMFFHIDGEADPREGIRKAREMLDFLVQFDSKPENYYMMMLRDQRADLLQRDDSYLCHEFLDDVNQPLYYHEFLERITVQGLKAVADAVYSRNACVAPGRQKAALDRVSDDPGRQEGYLDLLLGRGFRRTLLCHQEVELLPGPSEAAVERLQAAVKVVPGSLHPGFSAGVLETFQNWQNQAVTIDHPLIKAAVVVLGEHYPWALPFGELWRAATARLSDAGLAASEYGEPERQRLAAFLLRSYGEDWLELHSHCAPVVREPGERPATTSLVRHQARSGVPLTNLRHESFVPPRFDRHLLALLDGRRTHGALVDALDALVTEGTLTIRGSDPGRIDGTARRAIVAESLREGLGRLAAAAFLVA
jgi:SAM-dependent methyltransferase/methyltransferase-like protein